ncbi:MAG: shikimate dehydrogenase [Clostridia bacterium]|nr:shikimate dehydrogenase [Clostridia bacterium]
MAKYGLIGGKLGHSYSMGIHEKYFATIGEKSTYELIETPTENLKQTLENLANEGYCGINVTIPHKKAVMEFLDEIAPEAEFIGAVNTIKFENGKLFGFNTDYYGFGKTLDKFGIDISGKKTYILGTGGAANAVSAYCRNNGAEVIFVSRTPSNNAIGYDELKNVPAGGVLINCTPVGMYPDTDAAPIECVDGFDAVVDLIYNPTKTKLLKNAEEHGIKAVNGMYMLVAQAICAEAIWHNTDFEENIIDDVYTQVLNKMEAN